jgi:hypothetical protein
MNLVGETPMALTATQTGIVQLIVGMFDAAPGKSFLDQFTAAAEAGQTLDQLATELSGTVAFQTLYPTTQTNNEFATAFVANLLGNTVTSAPLAFAIDFVESQLNAGATIPAVMQIATQALLDAGSSHADFGVASATLANQILGASNYSETENSNDISVLQAAIASITNDVSTIPAVIVPTVPGETSFLTVGQDNLTGTANNDTFLGYIFDNQNTAQSGDIVDGGEGYDLLGMEIGNSQDFAISLKSTNVEQIVVRAQATATDSNQNNLDAVQVDAQDLVGATRYDSNNSRDDVVIEDVRIEDSEITADITVAMVATDPGNVDYGLYFDQPSLRAAAAVSAGAVLNIELMDTRSSAAGEDPLKESPYNAFTFTLDGTTYRLDSQAINDAQTYAELLVAIQDQLIVNVGLENITASITGTFDATDTDTAITTEGQTITLTNSAAGTFGVGNFIADDGVPASSGLHTNQDTTPPTQTGNLITSQVILDHVGRGSMGGDLVIGGLSTGVTSDSKGVEQFNITVERDSELQEISSTNNTLREVFITNGSTNGNLVVAGSTNADAQTVPGSQGNAGFTDVRIIDASSMVGSVDINAELTGDVVAKYMNLVDTQGNVAADDAEFVYTLGTNNDTLNLTTSNLNLAAAGSASREDFSLVVNGAAGNDNITHIIGNGAGNDGTAWYDNSVIEANITINGDGGNDTITTTGAGNATINAGSGNDTVYADNSGVKGSYAINATAASTALETANAAASAATAVLIAAETATKTVEVAATVAAAITAAKVITAASGHTAGEIAAMDLALDNAAVPGATQTDIFNTLVAATTAAQSNGALLVSDADVITGTANALLLGATLTVTYAGAAANSVISGVAAAGTEGYESSVVINTVDGLGNELSIVQAIKNAINNDATLSKLLTATDGTGSTLSIVNDIDGLSAVGDLEFSIVAANAAGTSDGLASAATNVSGTTTVLTATELTSLKAQWNDILNTSGAAITDAALYTQLGTAAAAALASVTQAVISVGNEATSTSDNVIAMGSGDDVIVLGTNDALLESNDTLTWSGYNQGNDTIVNYLEAGTNSDTIDLSAYLSDAALNKTSATGSVDSYVQIAQVKSTAAVTAADTIVANEIVIETGLTFSAAQQTAGQSFDNLTAANFASAINNASTVAYGNINAAIDADNTVVANFVGTTQTSVVFVENNLNLGEYKIFELSQDNTANLEFSDVQLIGTVDFGDSITIASTIV